MTDEINIPQSALDELLLRGIAFVKFTDQEAKHIPLKDVLMDESDFNEENNRLSKGAMMTDKSETLKHIQETAEELQAVLDEAGGDKAMMDHARAKVDEALMWAQKALQQPN
jgi:hypothetical protein